MEAVLLRGGGNSVSRRRWRGRIFAVSPSPPRGIQQAQASLTSRSAELTVPLFQGRQRGGGEGGGGKKVPSMASDTQDCGGGTMLLLFLLGRPAREAQCLRRVLNN